MSHPDVRHDRPGTAAALAGPPPDIAEQCRIVTRLLRDAGDDALADRLSITAAQAIYHNLVHTVADALYRWHHATGHKTGCDLATSTPATPPPQPDKETHTHAPPPQPQ